MIKKRKLRVIIFDWGDVLTTQGYSDSLYKFLKTSFYINSEELEFVLDDFHKSLNKKLKTEKQYWKEYAFQKNIKLPSNWFEILEKEKIASMSNKLNLEMLELIKELKNKGYIIVLFSNIIKEMADLNRAAGYYDIFDIVVLSYEIGYMKPDPESYNILLSKINEDPSQCLFIDNKKENIEAAKEKGIYGIIFKSPMDLQKQLQEIVK